MIQGKVTVTISFVPRPTKDQQSGQVNTVQLEYYTEAIVGLYPRASRGEFKTGFYRNYTDDEECTFFVSRHGLDFMDFDCEAGEMSLGDDIVKFRQKIKQVVDKAIARAEHFASKPTVLPTVGVCIQLSDQADYHQVHDWLVIRFSTVGEVLYRPAAAGMVVSVSGLEKEGIITAQVIPPVGKFNSALN